MDALAARLGRATVATAALFVVLFVASTIYTATGDTARDLLIQELLVNLVIVMGLQVFIGSTGILSFGHLAFAQIAAYGAALVTIPAASKATSLPDLPFGLGDVELGAVGGTIVGVIVATAVGAVVGVAVARAGGLAATMITLAVLFVVDQAVKNWTELTRGAGGLSGVPRIETNTWLWVAALGAILVATVFRETRSGRFAVATRDDEIAAAAIGIDRFWPRWTAWVISVAVVGLAGALRVQAVGSTNPQQYTLDVAVLVLAMLVAGGMRTVTGAFVGTVVVTVGNEVFRQIGDAQEIERLPDLFLSVVLLAVMLLRPGGLLGDADVAGWLRERARRRVRGSPAPEGVATPPDASKPSDGGAAAGGDLEASGITVRFGGFVALADAGVRVRPGEVVGLIGPNGAGKTTLFNVVTGIVAEEAGTVTLGDRDLTAEAPHRIARAGLARTFQNLRLFGTLSVHENVALAALERDPLPAGRPCRRRRRADRAGRPRRGRRPPGVDARLRPPAPPRAGPGRGPGAGVPAARRADVRDERHREPGDGRPRPGDGAPRRCRGPGDRPRSRLHHPHQRSRRGARRRPRPGRGDARRGAGRTRRRRGLPRSIAPSPTEGPCRRPFRSPTRRGRRAGRGTRTPAPRRRRPAAGRAAGRAGVRPRCGPAGGRATRPGTGARPWRRRGAIRRGGRCRSGQDRRSGVDRGWRR